MRFLVLHSKVLAVKGRAPQLKLERFGLVEFHESESRYENWTVVLYSIHFCDESVRRRSGGVTCHKAFSGRFLTWRAPSSPHLACGLNGSIFLRTCGSLSAAQAGRLFGVLEGPETCGTLRGWMLCATLISMHGRLNSVGASGKRLVFF